MTHIKSVPSSEFVRLLSEKSHVIWDWNGTLLDDIDHAVSTVNHLLKARDLNLVTAESYRQLFCFPVYDYYKNLGFDFTKESFEDLCHQFVDRFMHGFRELPLKPGMHKVLKDVRKRVIKQSILSATDQASLEEMMKHYELIPLLDHVFGINNKLAASKVARGHELVQISRISKEKTVLIGDTLHDLEVGRDIGIDVILLSHGHQAAERLRQHHDLVIDLIEEN